MAISSSVGSGGLRSGGVIGGLSLITDELEPEVLVSPSSGGVIRAVGTNCSPGGDVSIGAGVLVFRRPGRPRGGVSLILRYENVGLRCIFYQLYWIERE